jgi:TPR repeat protein
MTHATRFVASVAVLIALVLLNVSCESQTPTDALRARAEQGDAVSQVNLGHMYHTGEGVPQDYAEAVRWYRLAAEQGFDQAQTNLGVLYATGQGVPQDDAEAARLHRLAAEQGLADAQFNLGLI